MTTMTERFWAKVDVKGDDECWLWTGATRLNGYGIISIPGNNRVQVYAHRLSAAIHFGMFDRRLQVNHHCDVPSCVNPAHIYLGTQKENVRDMHERGRARGGFQRQTHCKYGHPLTDETTYVYSYGRQCRACKKRQAAANAAKVKQATP